MVPSLKPLQRRASHCDALSLPVTDPRTLPSRGGYASWQGLIVTKTFDFIQKLRGEFRNFRLLWNPQVRIH